MSWTEAKIQNLLAEDFNKRSCVCVPNCGVFGWIADLIRVTPRLLTAEYEIKISRADFRADTKGGHKKFRQLCLTEGESYRAAGRPVPNYFWYVAPPGIIPRDEIPTYAGLIEVTSCFQTVRPAPRLHKQPLDAKQTMFLVRGIGLRYWQLRMSQGATSPPELVTTPVTLDDER